MCVCAWSVSIIDIIKCRLFVCFVILMLNLLAFSFVYLFEMWTRRKKTNSCKIVCLRMQNPHNKWRQCLESTSFIHMKPIKKHHRKNDMKFCEPLTKKNLKITRKNLINVDICTRFDQRRCKARFLSFLHNFEDEKKHHKNLCLFIFFIWSFVRFTAN